MILFDVGGSDFGRCELAAAAKEHCCLIPSKVYGSSTIKFAFITYRNCSQKWFVVKMKICYMLQRYYLNKACIVYPNYEIKYILNVRLSLWYFNKKHEISTTKCGKTV